MGWTRMLRSWTCTRMLCILVLTWNGAVIELLELEGVKARSRCTRVLLYITCNWLTKDGGGGGWTRMLGGCSSTIPFFLVLTMGLSLRLSSLLSAALDGCSVSVNSGCSLVARRLEIRLVCSFCWWDTGSYVWLQLYLNVYLAVSIRYIKLIWKEPHFNNVLQTTFIQIYLWYLSTDELLHYTCNSICVCSLLLPFVTLWSFNFCVHFVYITSTKVMKIVY